MDKKFLEQMAGAKKLLGNFRIIGAPDQIVERNIEEIGERKELLIGGFTLTVFVRLIAEWRHAHAFPNLPLS